MYAEAYKSIGLARATYEEIPSPSSITACLDCSDCAARCVHGLDIAAKMKQAGRLLA